jgi:hypothetical protein
MRLANLGNGYTSDLDPQMIRNGLARQKMVSHDGGCYLSLMEVATLA